MAGVYVPADIFARFHRALGNDVMMVSGSDVHGTPITVRADQEGVDPQVIVDRYHAEFLDYWEKLDISWDLYTTTGTDNHRQVTWDVFRRLRDHGFVDRQVARQFYRPGSGVGSSPTGTSRAPARTAATPRRAATSATTADASSTPRT